MQNETTNPPENTSSTKDRRSFITKITVGGLGASLIGLSGAVLAQATKQPKQPEADNGHDYPMPAPDAKTESDFRNGVIGPAMLSLLTSEIAVDKTTNALAKEFSNFELREAIGVTTVLKNLGTEVPPMDANATATLNKIKTLPKGAAFDKAYIKAQLANHEFLRDLAESYLKNSEGQTSMPEMHGRNLAMLALGMFKEHVVHTKNMLKTM